MKESAGGRPCDGEDEQKKLCGQKPCPIDCVWADWNEWKACTKSCGAGITDRLRNISTPAAHGGKECFGSTRDVKTCNEEMCYADWEQWSECSRPCGEGTAIRYRIIDTPAARGGQVCLGPKHETGGCNGTDCVTTAELIRKGYASQITGAMHIITEDPVSYAANPLVEQVSREALAEFAELPVRRVHVSMMPDTMKPRDVVNWFSMLVPNSTNLTAVLDYISKKDLTHAGRILRNKLRRVGVLILVNISKLYVNAHGHKETDSTVLVNTTTGAPLPAWNNPNATRLTGVVKMIVPEPLKFAEDLKTKEATEQLLAELSGIAKPGVRASLIPDQVYRYEAEFDEDADAAESQAAKRKIPSDSIQNKSGEVHSWFSLVGAVQPNRETATAMARKIAQAMMAEDLKAVTVRNNLLLEAAGRLDAQTKVIQILAKADGDQEEVEENVLDQAPGQVRVTGVVEMVTDYPKSFSADRRSEEGLLQAIAQLSGMPTSSVRVSLVPSETRVESLLQQPTEGEEVPPETPLDDKDAFSNEVSAWFVITVPTKDERTPDEIAEKLRDQDLTIAGLKIQNCIMDEGLDLSVKVGRITAMVQTTTTTTLGTGVIKKVDFHGDAGPEGATGNKTSAAAAAAAANTVPGSSSVVGADASTPAKVIAVVAAVSPNDVEPPTMSNPGGGDEESDDEEQGSNVTKSSSLLETGAKSQATGLVYGMWLPIFLYFA